MLLIKVDQATAVKRRIYFHLVDAIDGITAETGEAGGQPQISTNGGSWTNTGIGTLTAVGNGRYYADLTQAATQGTAGDVIETRYKSAATAECPGTTARLVAIDLDDATALGVGNLDAAITSRLAPTTSGRTLDVTSGGCAGIDWANVEAPTTSLSLSGTSTKALEPTVSGRTLDVSADGEAGMDWANIGSPTTTVNLSGTSTKAVEPTVAGRTLDLTSGGCAGIDWSNVEAPTTTLNLSGTSTKALEPTVAGRTLDVSAGGEAGVDWANVGSPTTTVDLSGTSTKALEPTVDGRTLDVTATGAAGVDWANVEGQTTTVSLTNTTIATVTSVTGSVGYAPTSATRTVGSDQGGTYSNLSAHDDSSFSTGEDAGSGLSVLVVRSTSPSTETPSSAHVSGYYNGSPGHNVSIQAYSYSLSAWETIGTMSSRTTPFDYVVPLSSDHHNGSGEMQLRFLHNTATYNASHRLHLDFVSFDKVASGHLDSDVAAIKAKTDQLGFTAGNVHSLLADTAHTITSLSVTDGVAIARSTTNGTGLTVTGDGTGGAVTLSAGVTGNGVTINGGATSGKGIYVLTTDGAAVHLDPTAGVGVSITSADEALYATSTAATGAIVEGGGANPALVLNGGTTGKGAEINGGSGVGLDITGGTTPLAAGVVDQVVDQVWTEAIADHSGVSGSTAEALDDAAATAPTAADVADAVWDEAVAGHISTAGTFGQAMSSRSLFSGTSSGSTGNSDVYLDGGSATDDWYTGWVVHLTAGTGAGQARPVVDYDGTSKLATVASQWLVTPSSDTVFVVSDALLPGFVWDSPIAEHLSVGSTGEALNGAYAGVGTITGDIANVPANTAYAVWDESIGDHVYPTASEATYGQLLSGHGGRAQGGGASSITLQASGSSAINDFYNGASVVITVGAGAQQAARTITDYDGGTKVATVSPAWVTQPTSGSYYVVMPGPAAPSVGEVADAVWEEALADHSGTSGSTAEALGAADATGPSAADIWTYPSTNAVTFGKGIVVSNSNTNGIGVDISGNGQGTGVKIAGGDALTADVPALKLSATNGAGLSVLSTNSVGMYVGSSISSGVVVSSNSTTPGDAGVRITSHVAGVRVQAYNEGIDIEGGLVDGTKPGVTIVGGATGKGVEIAGGATSGAGIAVTTTSGAGLDLSGASTPLDSSTVNQLVDQTWRETLGDHSGTAGSTAEALNAATSPAPTASAVADAVWDEQVGDHTTPGSTGNELGSMGGAFPTVDEIADEVETRLPRPKAKAPGAK